MNGQVSRSFPKQSRARSVLVPDRTGRLQPAAWTCRRSSTGWPRRGPAKDRETTVNEGVLSRDGIQRSQVQIRLVLAGRQIGLHRISETASRKLDSCRGHQPIRWSKNRQAEDRLDVATIPHPDLGDHRLHHRLALLRRSIPQGALDIPDELRELGGVRDARLTLRYLLGQFRAPGLEL
jgi:hypothetical protein